MESKIFTFYSYKGGSGRSTTLVNTTLHLARKLNASKEHPILLVDADLESAGITYFFGCEKKFTSGLSCATVHAEAFLNNPEDVLTGKTGDNTFCRSLEYLCSCDGVAQRIQKLYPEYDCTGLFAGVRLRQTILKILDCIVNSTELVRLNKASSKECYLAKTYDLETILNGLYFAQQNDVEQKRKVVEKFLPTDGMVDISDYFGLEEGSIKFIGADVSFRGEHVSNVNAYSNRTTIAGECGKNGFSAILFDCGAGVQSSAHVLNEISDVIVYCMRPTQQFISGTINQLEVYNEKLEYIVNLKKAVAELTGEDATDKKSVILVPTAVPEEKIDTLCFENDSFRRIGYIGNHYKTFLDNTFCNYKDALREVSLFKWREFILGTIPINIGEISEQSKDSLEVYSSYETMPNDAKKAFETYQLLAERLIFNA